MTVSVSIFYFIEVMAGMLFAFLYGYKLGERKDFENSSRIASRSRQLMYENRRLRKRLAEMEEKEK